ncbi:MAG TPA: phosphatase PAP2 family protein [Candidatus Saccharimonadales bacterium]|nr:phosphatase PAP2 family protein [Candidatus Saccharimonadales bacterium]
MTKNHRLVTLILVGYLAAIIGFMLLRNMSLTPDRIFLILLFGAIIIGRGKTFLRDWIPFVALLIGYEMLRGFADTAGFHVHVVEMINADKAIFGFVPGVELQRLFFTPAHIHFWDVGAVMVDFLHFLLPLAIAFYFWINSKKSYWQFVIALLVLSFAGFITYLLFPAAPPWYADQRAHLIHIHKVVDYVVAQIGWGWDFSTIYNHLNPNQVAAMPSLHSAYPWLAFLALRNFNKKIGYFFLPYPILVWISVVYLGEHYVIDVLAGIAYATVVYLVVYHFSTIKAFVKRLLGNFRGKEPVIVAEPSEEI